MPLTSDSLVSTKLRPPEARPTLVGRPRLTEKLEREPGRRLTLVSAPAGFGKTTLLNEWLESHGERSAAWVSLDEGDNDAARFLFYLVAALRSVEEGVGEGVLSSLRSPGTPPIEAVTGALVNELAFIPHEELVIVLDDYHVIEAEPVHGIVSFLLDHLPPNVHLTIAGRVDPPLPLSRLRVRGQMTELRAAELRFTTEEAAAFLDEVMGLDLTAEDVAALEERTEGWVAGLQLAALSMRDREDLSGFVEAFSGSHRDVLDFLTEEVLERQPEPVRDFLLKTSILDHLNGPLCDALTGASDGQRTLERLDGENLFLIPLDDERVWYRYHHLFADFLRGRLRREHPERVARLHLRAASWYEREGWASEAVGHALAAGDHEWAARLVEQDAQALVLRGEGATLDRWLSALPAELVRSRPQLCLAMATTALMGGRLDEVEPLLADAERAHATAGEPPVGGSASGLANVPGMIALARAWFAREHGDAERTITFARRALTCASEDDRYMRFLAGWDLAVATLMQGRASEVEDALADLVRDPWARGHNRYLAVRACYTLSQAHRGQGRLGAALGTCQEALELAAEADRSPLPAAAGVAHVGLAEISYERNELDTALRHATEAVAIRRQLGSVQWLAAGLAILARIRQARGDRDRALEAIGEAERVGLGPEMIHLFNPVQVNKARLMLLRGEVAEAARWTAERAPSVDQEVSYVREPEHLVLVRVLIASEACKPEQALGLLERLLAAAEATERLGSVIEILALEALALLASREKERAVSALARALVLAEPEGYVRIFVDEGPPMAALLSEVLEVQQRDRLDPPVPAHYLRKLLAALKQDAAGVVAPDQQLPEPLSERELEVLALIAAGKTNPEIAGELFVARNTVKTHIKNIYHKLDARNRAQALSRARELDLI